ncbi:M23 family metallopeptidase [Rhodoferax sp. PAMC 29310]|uniref:M23 family metallopeptidase n=1 Tax=Rhodoferax sp. PAMC 29310 TaxID=2822760 RepID=UPI001B32C3E1|nr:M23 family metallopeptidase [Rhodoferax sp. PAMC 29310]
MKNGLTPASKVVTNFVVQSLQQHPKRITALIASFMLLGGGGAYAVASFGPDAANIPVQQIAYSVEAGVAYTPPDVLAIQPLTLFRSELTRSSDTADTLLKRLGVADVAAAAFIRADNTARDALLGRSGRNVTAETNEDNSLLKLSARWASDESGNFNRLVLEKTPAGFQSRVETAPLTVSSKLASGTIESSLFAATDNANIPDAVAIQVAEIFSGDIDFQRALRKGDRFSIVYETLEGDGEPLRTGRVLSTEFMNNGKTFQAMWFQDPARNATASNGQTLSAGKGAYYTLDGQSLTRAFLASPLEFTRMTSAFKMRFHPILKTWKAHTGVDYAGSTGTPIRSVGDGVVEFSGVQNGYGNVVFINHGKQKTTVYAHMSKINVRKGQSVSQGQNIGAVGSSGWATGPHLHFEFRDNGVPKDPLILARQSESIPLSAGAKPVFSRLAAENRVALNAAYSLLPAGIQ